MLPTITVDVGTTSVKLCMFDASGAQVTSARLATPTRKDAWGEIYDLESITEAISGFIRGMTQAVRESVKRVAITGVGESGGLVRPDLSLASPMILWHDHRGAGLLEHLSPSDRAMVYAVTGLPVNANYGLSKVAWASRQAGNTAAQAQWLNIAEYLAALMTGQRWSEYSLASRTMALDLTTGKWSPEVAALVGLDVGIFPEVHPAGTGAPVTNEYARRTGLGTDVLVHVAGHDHMVGAIGAGLQAGEMLNSTGTTEGLLFLRETPSLGESSARSKLANGISCTGEEYTLFASIPTGGSAFATLQSMLGLTPETLTACIATAHESYLAGRFDLGRVPLVLPQFRGSPPPTKKASARGVIAGLQTDTSTEELVFGCFLGMALQFRDVLNLFPDNAPERIKVIGPASLNPLWLQLKADLLGTPLSVSQLNEVVSRGAQALASGRSCDWSDCQPADITVDDHRHSQLSDWSEQIHLQWEYLKGVPA